LTDLNFYPDDVETLLAKQDMVRSIIAGLT
jgi:hypothetical protein